MSRRAATLWLMIFALVYGAIVIPHWNFGHLDFGDGNYMYIGWRVSQGAVLYRDVLAPQPPMHLYTGALLAWLGQALPHPIYAFRAFSLLLHIATMLVIYLAAVRVTGGNDMRLRERCRASGVIAAAIYMLLPLGFWWSLGYQSEPLEMFFFLLSFVLFITWKPVLGIPAGVLQALAPLTNMTAAPYTLFNIGYVIVRRRRMALSYILPLVLMIAGVTILMELITGAYLENVILNQVGSFPRAELLRTETPLHYAFRKIVNEGADVLRIEGGYIVLGLLGLLRYSRRGARDHREYVALYSFFALCSIIYVSKGGTMDYIFTIGEPFIAIFSGYLLFHFWRKHLSGAWHTGWNDLSHVVAIMTGVMAVVVVTGLGLHHSYGALKQGYGAYPGWVYELPDLQTRQLVEQIRRNSRPDGLIIAPPHYAFMAQRRIAEDYSELFLWSLKYHNERLDRVEGRGVKTVLRLAQLLREKKIDYVMLDLNQTARIPEIMHALQENYAPQRQEPYVTLNTRLQFYKPQ